MAGEGSLVIGRLTEPLDFQMFIEGKPGTLMEGKATEPFNLKYKVWHGEFDSSLEKAFTDVFEVFCGVPIPKDGVKVVRVLER